MNKLINRRHIIIIGIISLLATGIILSSNWNYFIQNNENNNHLVSSYQINTEANIYTKYSQEENSIMFQINVLKSAIKKNNIMYQQYNNIFKHNINYIHIQRNMIRNRINVANSSIKHEIDILNNMENIVYNHPYNYLKFFQGKNYTLPQIVSQIQINHSYSLNNIKTYTQNINNSNTSVKNISYQSEEAMIGIGAITSIASASKTLIFSKVHFDYGSVYYFSSNLNNLSTNDQAKSDINLTNIQPTGSSQNKFINYKKTDNTNLSNFDPIKATSNLFNIYHFLKKNRLTLILGFVGGTISVAALGFLAAAVRRSSKKYSARLESMDKLITDVFESVERPMNLISFRRQIIRHARYIERPELSRVTKSDINVSINEYVNVKKRDAGNIAIYNAVRENLNTENVRPDSIQLETGETTTINGWFKIPVFEKVDYTKLTRDDKESILIQINDFKNLINRLPSNSEKGLIRNTMGSDIAAEIFRDFREVAIAHIDFLRSINEDDMPFEALQQSTALEASADNQVAETQRALPNFHTEFWKNTKLRKDNPADVSHIPSIDRLLNDLESIAEYGTL